MSPHFPALFPALTEAQADPDGPGAQRPALRFGDRSLTYGELAATASPLAARVAEAGRIAVWATPTLETAVAVVAALLAGVPAVPLNPKSGESELGHIVSDSAPTLVLAAPGTQLPPALAALERVDIDVRGTGASSPATAPPPPSDPRASPPKPPPSSSTPPAPPAPRRAPSSPAGPSPPPWTPSRTPGSGPVTTSSCTVSPSSTCTA